MQLQELLFSQGFGTRRICAGLIQRGLVTVEGSTCDDPAAEFETAGLTYSVQGENWKYCQHAYLMLHKPAGTECSQRPSAYPSVYTLLPAPLRQRPSKSAVAGVQAIGRLDQDTTGLLLLTDDGAFVHRMSSPRHHVPKVYEVSTEHPVEAQQIQQLLTGVLLQREGLTVRAAACEATGSHSLRLTLTEGKHHQVKRMLAAAGNPVVALHRSRIGRLALPPDLPAGQWRWVTEDELTLLHG